MMSRRTQCLLLMLSVVLLGPQQQAQAEDGNYEYRGDLGMSISISGEAKTLGYRFTLGYVPLQWQKWALSVHGGISGGTTEQSLPADALCDNLLGGCGLGGWSAGSVGAYFEHDIAKQGAWYRLRVGGDFELGNGVSFQGYKRNKGRYTAFRASVGLTWLGKHQELVDSPRQSEEGQLLYDILWLLIPNHFETFAKQANAPDSRTEVGFAFGYAF